MLWLSGSSKSGLGVYGILSFRIKKLTMLLTHDFQSFFVTVILLCQTNMRPKDNLIPEVRRLVPQALAHHRLTARQNFGVLISPSLSPMLYQSSILPPIPFCVLHPTDQQSMAKTAMLSFSTMETRPTPQLKFPFSSPNAGVARK